MRLRRHVRSKPVEGSERGALIVELAIVALFLVMLLAGAFDFGMGWRASLAATEGVRAGARVGSSVGRGTEADRDLLLSMKATMAASKLLPRVERVILFRSGSANGAVPPSCKTGTSNGDCNIFTGDEFRNIEADSDLNDVGCIVDSSRKAFCPENREDTPLIADYLGVYIKVAYKYQFPMLGNTLTIERTSIMRLEPA